MICRIVTACFISLVSIILAITPAYAAWGDINPNCVGSDNAEDVATLTGLECLFSNVLGVVIRLVGLTTFIMIIVGGFKFLISSGDPKAAEAGQKTITMGVVGLIIAISAWFILLFIENFTGASVTQFKVGLP